MKKIKVYVTIGYEKDQRKVYDIIWVTEKDASEFSVLWEHYDRLSGERVGIPLHKDRINA